MDENANLRRLLAEEQSQRRAGDEHLLAEQAGRKEERAWREEAERRLLEEQRQPEKNRSLTLLPFLEACHHLSLMLQVQTDDSKATTGVVTNPVGRLYPRQIIRWQGFQEKQQDIWKQLMDPGFMTQHSFVPRINQDRFKSHLKPISCELDVRLFERDTVETEVEQLLAAVANDQKLQESLGLRGDVFFQSHMNLGNNQRDLSTKGKAKGVIGAADQFCIHSKPDGTIAAKLAIEFKAPHKLPQNVVEEGLSSEIRPDTDNINMGSDDPALASRALAAAVVTQLFSNMIGIGVQYGYVCTGQTYIFLHIPDDPSIVYYHVSVPNKDVCDDDEFRLCKTAVAQVFAFVLQSLVVESPPQSWRDAAEELDVWSVESAGTLSPVSDSVDNGVRLKLKMGTEHQQAGG
ncbi:hypothetical protein SEPCBS119000_001438 [Sporothrix epigloea]|uniref:Uncharacterized protein n=1 Tax=Sporothrix epigloea TaxID=1892477 RepID=A0ABP0DDW3_9PEZI